MYLEVIVFLLVLIIQLTLAAYSYSVRKDIPRKYSKPLSSRIELGETLESFMEVVNEYNIKVKVIKKLGIPALGKNGVLYINRDSIYRTDLFSNYSGVSEAVMLLKPRIYSNLPKYQSILFFINTTVFALGIILNNDLGAIFVKFSTIFSIVLIVFSYLFYWFLDSPYKLMRQLASSIFKMDDVEEARANSLNKDLKLIFLEYPLKPIILFVGFFKP